MTILPWKWIAVIVAFVLYSSGLWIHGHHIGSEDIQSAWDRQKLADQVAQQVAKDHEHMVTNTVLTQYVDRFQVVLTQGATITKEVTKYVTKEADAKCVVPMGFVRVFNAAAEGSDPLSIAPGSANDASSGIALSTVASVTSDNFTACRLNAEKLTALQRWVSGLNGSEKLP